MSIDQQFIEYIVKTLVNKPEAVSIERTIDERGVLLTLTVDPEDVGRIIGKRGATAQSLRTLLRALGTKNEARYNLKIVNNDGYEGGKSHDDNRDDRGEASMATASDEAAPVEDATQSEAQAEPVENAADKPVENPDDSDELAEKTRKELAELDDLDI